ncbi:MAG: hypothetical protein JO277_13630 [Candidatus Eremiobacteraeota bacterium]|nr:hypothetical protein [Candidatus Eremiobacteraeota bacterium]
MSSQELASQALADLESKINAGLTAVRTRSAEAKSKLEHGVLNLQNRSELSPVAAEAQDAAGDLNWDLETEAAAESAEPAMDDFQSAAPEPLVSFKDELDVATDEDGIPLGD